MNYLFGRSACSDSMQDSDRTGDVNHYRPVLLFASIPMLIVIMFAVPIYVHTVIEIRIVALSTLIMIATGFSIIIALGAIVDLFRRRPFDVNRALMLGVVTFGNMTLFVTAAKIDNANLL